MSEPIPTITVIVSSYEAIASRGLAPDGSDVIDSSATFILAGQTDEDPPRDITVYASFHDNPRRYPGQIFGSAIPLYLRTADLPGWLAVLLDLPAALTVWLGADDKIDNILIHKQGSAQRMQEMAKFTTVRSS